jgi:hypothetical protein
MNLCKVFQFSKDNTYTSNSITFLRYLHTNMPNVFKEGDIDITLIQDGELNAYVYDEWYTGDEVFLNWYDKMSALKKEQPKNELVKWLSSGLWGNLSRYNHKYVSLEETCQYTSEEFNIWNIGAFCKKDGSDVFRMIDTDDIGNRFIRIKPFLTSLGRVYIANAMYKLDPTLNNIVRVFCDSISINKEVKVPNTKNFKLLQPEKKTTGTIIFKNRSRFYNKDLKYFAGQWSQEDKRNICK